MDERQFGAVDFPIDHSPRESVAFDVTQLLAAASFVSPLSGQSDPRASAAFEAVATDYCSGCKLVLPLPGETEADVPIFLDIWRADDSAITQVPSLELTTHGFDQIAAGCKDHFVSFIEGEASNVVKWVAFQFADEVVQSHLLRSDKETILRASAFSSQLIKENRLPTFMSALQSRQESGFVEPSEYTELLRQKDILSISHLCAAYIASVSLRRLSYAMSLNELTPRPEYQHHWIGLPVLRSDILPDTVRVLEKRPPTSFPWGSLLKNVFSSNQPLTERTPDRVRSVLTGLRSRADRFREEYLRAPLHPPGTAQPKGPTAREELVIKTLADVGIVPRYKGSVNAEKRAGWLRRLAGDSRRWQIPVEVVTGILQSEWVRRLQVSVRLKYRRQTFWEVFEDPGIREIESKRERT